MTNAVIGALRVNLGLDTAEFQDSAKRAQSTIAQFAKTAVTAMAAAGAAIATALAVGIKNAIDEADDLSKIAAKIGVPIEELSKLKYAADLSGVSIESLTTSTAKLAQNMAKVAGGAKGGAAKTFEDLGISVKNVDGSLKTTSQVIGEVSDKFATLENGPIKTAAAMAIFGKSGADLIPLLNGGSAAIRQLTDEAKLLGLEISAKTGAAAEQFNDNLSRMGYAVSGLTLGLTAALAPALAVVSDSMVALVQSFLGALQYLPMLGQYALVAGGALAIMFSPAIIAAAGSLAFVIGTGLVGAVNLLTAAIAANPLGALAVGITAALVAIYHFRDEIQAAIGVDVVGIAKTAANLVIGSFVAAFEDIKFIWNQFPNIIGAAVIGAVNAVVSGVNIMIQKAAGLVDGLIDKVNGALSMIPGAELSIGKIGAVGGVEGIPNMYADALGKAVGDRNTAVNAAMNKDYIGEIGKAFTASTPAVTAMGSALAGVNGQLDDMGGGGGGGGKGGSGKKGKVAKVKDEFDKVAGAIESAKQSLGQGFGDVLQGLIDKSSSWKDALQQAGKALIKYLDQINIAQGGKGLFGGGLVQGLLGSLVGFASGGSIMPGGAGGIDSQLVAFRKSPNERVDITKPGQSLVGGGRGGDTYHIDARGADASAITRLERGLQERDRVFTKRVDSRVDTRHKRGTRA